MVLLLSLKLTIYFMYLRYKQVPIDELWPIALHWIQQVSTLVKLICMLCFEDVSMGVMRIRLISRTYKHWDNVSQRGGQCNSVVFINLL